MSLNPRSRRPGSSYGCLIVERLGRSASYRHSRKDLALWRSVAKFVDDDDYVFAVGLAASPRITTWRNWRKGVFLPAAASVGVSIGRPYDLRHSFASLLIHEGRSLAEVAVQLGDAVATVAATYTHAFVEAEVAPREPAADAIETARVAAGVRQMYVELEKLTLAMPPIPHQ